ncbi:putative membrane protein [Larkinella arboricola]|uniref:Putative membrane protein n=1 Tax=Larkinella arboricola TaxID=643671 RepID=A0A327X878_LARAB|nr:DUF819 family protein [Larkinella arboricola]RAJ99826.1 putative membrane protein [Larkinella arboricola]
MSDPVTLGVLFLILAVVLSTADSPRPFWQRFYHYVPATLLCYFLPSLLNTFGWVDADNTALYPIVSRVLLPASLVLFTLSVDFKAFRRLGRKSMLMFAASAVSIMLGGPLAVWLIAQLAPELVGGQGPDAVWRGLATLAGTWIGGGANQTALKEVFQPSSNLFSAIVTVDVFISNLWLGVLLYGTGQATTIDRWLRADASAVEEVKDRVRHQVEAIRRIPSSTDLMVILAIGFGATAVAHALAGVIAPYIDQHSPLLSQFSLNAPFFWIVGLATAIGIGLSFTKARNLEGAGASKVATVFLYLMIATIGLKMNILAIADHPGLILVGLVWMLFHVLLMIGFSRLIRAPYFFLAVGSQACIGGPATAPIIAAAFHPVLAPVGVLMAILGYAVGTYMGYVCGILMQLVSP